MPEPTREILEVFKNWNPPAGESVGHLYDVSRKTLDEVTRLTEYEDGKASRVLTAVAFLSGLAGGVFAAFLTKVPMVPWQATLFHTFFFAFALCVVIGALYVLTAIRPQFNIPHSWADRAAKAAEGTAAAEARPRSFLFALQIMKTDPKPWAEAFKATTAADVDALKAEYVKDHVHEAYLVAEKVGKKLRPLQIGMRLFQWGIGLLIAWLIFGFLIALMQTWTTKGVDPRTAPVVFTDADNTLWDTNGLYAEAQLELLRRLESAIGVTIAENRLDFVRSIDQRIAKDHPDGLRYPPALLVEELARSLTSARDSGGVPSAAEPTSAIGENSINVRVEAERYATTVGGMPSLRVGVRSGLERLRSHGIRTYIVTEGSETSALRRANYHDLLPLINGVIETKKSPEAFAAIAAKHRGTAKALFSVGDQLDRDVVFAQQAQFVAIYFPGGFSPAWLADYPNAKADFQVASFEEVADVAMAELGD